MASTDNVVPITTNSNGQLQATNPVRDSGSTKVGGDLGKNAFLELLVTQMKYQDPFNPMEDTDYLAQLAQFSSLEQMENLNNQFSQYNGHSMIGKYGIATYTDPTTLEQKVEEGIITAVTYKNGETYAVIDEKEIPMVSVKVVQEAATAEDIAKIQQLQAGNAFALVGKYVEGEAVVKGDKGEVVKDDKGNPKVEDVKGVVDQVLLNNGSFTLVIGDKKVGLTNISKVYNEAPEEAPEEE